MKQITADSFYHGKVRIYQHRKGYRFALDSVLLAAWTELRSGWNLELGCGNGAVSLMLAWRFPYVSIVGVDIQQELLELFHRSVKENGFSRLYPVAGDVKALPFREKFAVVFANPPYQSPAEGRVSPYREIALSRFEIAATLADFVKAAASSLQPEGEAFFIVGRERKEHLLQLAEEEGLYLKEELEALPEPRKKPVFYLARFSRKKGKVRTFPALVMKEAGRYTPLMERIFEGKGLRELL